MENQNEHLRHILLFYFRKGKNAVQAFQKLCAVYDEESLTERRYQRWFTRFRSGDFSLKDSLRSGRLIEVDDDKIKALIESNRLYMTREISEKLNVSHTSIQNHLKQLGYIKKLDIWVDSSKARSGKKIETSNIKTTSVKRRINAVNKPPSKKAKTEPKKTEQKRVVNESGSSASKKEKNEPKQMLNKIDTNLDEIEFGCTKSNEEGKKHNLKICTWNVSGIRAVIKKNGIDYINTEDADIIALQETKCDKDKLPDEVKLSGYHYYFLDSKKPGYCGVAFYSKEKPISVTYGLNNSEFDNEGRMITAEFLGFFLVNVYVPNAGQKLVTLPKRLEWNKEFKKCIKELDKKKPVIICGDMNVAHKEIDLKNPKTNTKNAGFTKEERDDMTDFLAAGFIDTFRLLYPDKTDAYTFWSYFANARSKDIGWRLDYIVVSDRIKSKVCDNVIRKMVYGSDHCPVVLYINL